MSKITAERTTVARRVIPPRTVITFTMVVVIYRERGLVGMALCFTGTHGRVCRRISQGWDAGGVRPLPLVAVAVDAAIGLLLVAQSPSIA